MYEVYQETGLGTKEKITEFRTRQEAEKYAEKEKTRMLKKPIWQRAMRNYPRLKLTYVRKRS